MKKAGGKKPVKALPRPNWGPQVNRFLLLQKIICNDLDISQAIIFGIITNKKFDMIVMAFIGLNMVSDDLNDGADDDDDERLPLLEWVC